MLSIIDINNIMNRTPKIAFDAELYPIGLVSKVTPSLKVSGMTHSSICSRLSPV